MCSLPHTPSLRRCLVWRSRGSVNFRPKGCSSKPPGGGYRLHESVRNYIGRLRNREATKSADAKERLLVTQAELAEMEAQQRAGELVAVADVERHWTDLVAHFCQRMLFAAAPGGAARGRGIGREEHPRVE